MPQDSSRSVIDPKFYRPAPRKLDKSERQKPKPMTTDLPEQAELDEFYASKREKLSAAVLEQLFNATPRQPAVQVKLKRRVKRAQTRGWALEKLPPQKERTAAHKVGATIVREEGEVVGG